MLEAALVEVSDDENCSSSVRDDSNLHVDSKSTVRPQNKVNLPPFRPT